MPGVGALGCDQPHTEFSNRSVLGRRMGVCVSSSNFEGGRGRRRARGSDGRRDWGEREFVRAVIWGSTARLCKSYDWPYYRFFAQGFSSEEYKRKHMISQDHKHNIQVCTYLGS